ncbi:MAG: hypothetical protein RJA81_39, partial [Planctomycetota bacterium]
MNSTKPAKDLRPSRRFYRHKQLFGMRGWTWFNMNQVGWWIREEWFDRLVGPHGLKWKEWEQAGRLRVVKNGPLRTVYHVDQGTSGLFIKHYRVPGLRAKIRQWLRRGKARNEGEKALKLAGIGVSTVEPVALGEQRRLGVIFENYLVTREIADVHPLDQYLEQILPNSPAEFQKQIRRLIGEELARLCARLHEQGFVHQDFHPGNLLIRLSDDHRPHLMLIDLDALSMRKVPLSIDEIRDNLAQLNNYFWSRSSRVERIRFLEAYLKFRKRHNPLAPMEMARFARAIEEATRSWAERLWRRWAKRGQGTNKYFKTFTGPATWGVMSRKLDRDQVKAVIQDPDRLIYASDSRILKHSKSSTVAEVTIRTVAGDRRVILKKIPTLKASDFWFGWIKAHRSWRSWKASGHMVARGIATPEPLAYISKGAPGMPGFVARFYPSATYTIQERPDQMISLARHMEEKLIRLPEDQRTAALLASVPPLARLIRHMHDMSISHRDLKAANILVRPLPDQSWNEMSLIDLVGVTLQHPMPQRTRVKNLARLTMSFHAHQLFRRTDGLRFLRSYLPMAYQP